jgi:beta-galactosidase/beta-glucuronidase
MPDMNTSIKIALTVISIFCLEGMPRVEGQDTVNRAGRHIFPRDFAPTDDYTKPQERPFRDDICLNGSWKFLPVEGAAQLTKEQLTNPDVPVNPSWESTPVKVPSPWNVNSFAGGDHGGDFITYPSYPQKWESVRAGWLMRKLPYRKEWKGKRLILHFTAVAGYAQVFVNGQKVGQNFDVFLPFDIDITDHVRKDGDNELLLWIADANLFNEPGKFGRRIYVGGSFWGQHIIGIWQDVYLQARPDVYVRNTAIRPYVSRDELEVESTLRNESGTARRVRVSARVSPWINGAGHSTEEAPEPKWKLGAPALELKGPEVLLAPHSEQKVTFKAAIKGRLRLWSPSSPSLYGLVTSVDGASPNAPGATSANAPGATSPNAPGHTPGVPLDRQYTRFGWREGRIIGNKFYLNEHPWS